MENTTPKSPEGGTGNTPLYPELKGKDLVNRVLSVAGIEDERNQDSLALHFSQENRRRI